MNQSMTFFILSFLLWAVLHSLTAAHWVKNWAEQRLGSRRYLAFYRLGYNVLATLTFLPVLILYWQLPDRPLWAVPAPWSWVMVAGQIIGAAGLVISVVQAHALAFLGLQQVADYFSGQQDRSKAGLGEELVVGGVYRYMRHPLYTFSMLVLWLMPVVSRNYFILAVLATAYFLIGSIFEERRLLLDFGRDYEAYRRRVPRFLPRIW